MRELECSKNTSPLIHIKLELKKEDSFSLASSQEGLR
jgi:hypothetical protein